MAGNSFQIIGTDDSIHTDFGCGDTKVCKECGEDKPLLEFHKEALGILGRKAICKSCLHKTKGSISHGDNDMIRQALEAAAYRILKERGL